MAVELSACLHHTESQASTQRASLSKEMCTEAVGDDAGTAMGTELGVVIVRECTCMRAGATALKKRPASVNSRLRPLNVQPNFSARKAGLKRHA